MLEFLFVFPINVCNLEFFHSKSFILSMKSYFVTLRLFIISSIKMLYLIIEALILLVLCFLFYLDRHHYNYWSSRGVLGPRPLPLIGNAHSIAVRTFIARELDWTARYGKCYGKFIGIQPWLTITDHRLIRQVLATDFPHFLNRMNLKTLNPYWNNNLLAVDGQNWRRIRSLTTPAFTGSKLRGMHPLMGRSVEKLLRYLNSTFTSFTSSKTTTVRIKSIIACFAIDVIASTSFATETDAISSEDGKEGSSEGSGNDVVANCRQMFVIPPLRLAAVLVLPKAALRLLGIDCFLPHKPFQYLINLTRHIVRERRAADSAGDNATDTVENKNRRVDLVQLLLDAKVDESEVNEKSGLSPSSYDHLEAVNDGDGERYRETAKSFNSTSKSLTGLSETEIIAQGIFFLTAGFESSSGTISHALFELAQNPSIQAKLYKELKTALDLLPSQNRSSPEYFETILNGLPYLEASLKETLRKYAPVQVILRTTVTDGHQLENGLCLEKGQVIEIPIGAVHYCPDYYPQPEQFRPERFLPENKHKLVPYTYLPFGAGPRNCVGFRFAMEEMKICLAALLEQFEFLPAPNTPKQLSYQRGTPVLNAAEFSLKMSKRVEGK